MKDKFYTFFKLAGEYALYGLLFSLAISNAPISVFEGLLLLCCAGRKAIKPDFSFLRFKPNIFLLLFLLFSAFSFANSGQFIAKSNQAFFGKWMQYLGICLVVQDSIYDRKVIRRGIAIFLCGAALAIVSGLSQYFLNLEFLRHNSLMDIGGGVYAISSSFNHYNAFGGYLVVVLALLMAILISKKSFSQGGLSLLVFSILTSLTLIMTYSRGSWLAAVFVYLYILLFAKVYAKWLIPVFAVTMVVFLLPQFQGRLLVTFEPHGDSNRLRYWMVALKMIKDHPFLGIGMGTFMSNFAKYRYDLQVSYAHNCYLQIWAETGPFSLLSFLAFVFSVIYLGTKRFLSGNSYLLLGLLAGVLGFLVHSFFEVNLYSFRLAIMFWAWMGLTIAMIQHRSFN